MFDRSLVWQNTTPTIQTFDIDRKVRRQDTSTDLYSVKKLNREITDSLVIINFSDMYEIIRWRTKWFLSSLSVQQIYFAKFRLRVYLFLNLKKYLSTIIPKMVGITSRDNFIYRVKLILSASSFQGLSAIRL